METERKVAPEIVFPKIQLKHKDYFDLKKMYLLMYYWFKHEQWVDARTGGPVEQMEEFFLERTGATGAKDHIFYWDVEKFPTNEYFKYSMGITVSTLFVNTTEIMKDGIKIKTNVGEIKVQIQPKLHPDYKGYWINHPIFGSFYGMLQRTFFRKDISAHKAELYQFVYSFQAEIKRYLKLQQFTSPKEPFITERVV